MNAKDKICAEIQDIMRVYREQEKSAYGVDTPGGLEHMGDVWGKLAQWDKELELEAPTMNLLPDEQQAIDDEVCVRCGEFVAIRNGDDPTPHCDHCAHELVAELRERDRWIPISERLPNCYYVDFACVKGEVHRGTYNSQCVSGYKWWDKIRRLPIHESEVTHWIGRPLPVPPQGEQNG